MLRNTLNPHFTFNYTQPEEYRFSHDSVFLARAVFELFSGSLEGTTCLDLCSGSGIVGLDFLFHCKTAGRPLPAGFDFLEIQKIYEEHFKENQKRFGEKLPNVDFLNENYDVLKSETYKARYDLIISNPPYFRVNQGMLSPSDFKNRCRFFLDSNFENLITGIDNSLKPNGAAYMLLRDLKNHGSDPLQEAREILQSRRIISIVGNIRGTPLIQLK